VKTHLINFKYIGIVLSFIFLFWLLFFNFTRDYQVSIKRNYFTGELSLLKPGITITSPWVQIIRLDTRPKQYCVECVCKNKTCVLASFNPIGWREFIDREGFRYFWFRNRISFNSYKTYRGFDSVIRGYSFDEQEYSFIKIHSKI